MRGVLHFSVLLLLTTSFGVADPVQTDLPTTTPAIVSASPQSSPENVQTSPDKKTISAEQTLWQSFKNYWLSQKIPSETTAKQPEEKLEKKLDTNSTAPSLGVWGTINRFFQSKTSSADDTLKAVQPKPDKTEIVSQVEPTPADQIFEHNTPEKIKVAGAHPHSDTIVSHKATYTISLAKNYSDDVSDASGEMTINVYDTGDGYVFEQNSKLIIYNGDGEGEEILTNLATWQDYEGKRYRFNSKTVRNNEQEEIIKGEALKDSEAKVTRITYSEPSDSQITTPYETVFPLHHLIHALEQAKLGKSVVSDIVFDGSSETHEAVNVDTLLGAPKSSDLKIKTNTDTSVKNQWPMRLAVYIPGSNNPEPDYEMVQNVLDDGVIKDMTLDYGTFQVKATLEKIDFYETPKKSS